MIKILSLFNAQTNRTRASTASFQHVGQAPYSRGTNKGKIGPSKIWSILANRTGVVELDQNFKSFQRSN